VICECCGAEEWEPTGYNDVRGLGVNLMRCTGCGAKTYDRRCIESVAYYNSPGAISYAELDAKGSPSTADTEEAKKSAEYRDNYYGKMLDKVTAAKHTIGIPPSLYEAGFGAGAMLVLARSRGWKVAGCDLNGRSVALLAKGHRIKCANARFQDAKVKGTHDLVVMLDYIEHTETPRQDLEKARRILRPGGALLLKTFYDEFHVEAGITPESVGPEVGFSHYSVEGTGYFDPWSHPWHFDKPVLKELIERCGFDVFETELSPACGQIAIYARKP